MGVRGGAKENTLRPILSGARRILGDSKAQGDKVVSLVKFALTYLVIFLLQRPMEWASNEIHYLSQAKFGGDPSSTVFASGYENLTNPLYQLVTSTLVRAIPVEIAWAGLELTGIGILALGLLRFASVLRISLPALLLSLFVYVEFGYQSYLGGEWIIQGFEAKVPAYGFAFLALASGVSKKQRGAWVFAFLSILMHPLVGALAVASMAFFTSWKVGLATPARFLQMISPFLLVGVYLAISRLLTLNGSSYEESREAQLIHSLGRVPHHTAPFGGPLPSNDETLVGWFEVGQLVLPAVMIGLLLVSLAGTQKATSERRTILIVIALHLWIPISLFASWVDRDSQFLGPLFIYRPLAVLFLLSLLVVFGRLLDNSNQELMKAIVTLVVIWLLAGSSIVATIQIQPIAAKNSDGVHLAELIQQNTEIADAVLVDFSKIPSSTGIDEQTFELIVHRGTLASFKFVPTSTRDILDWWDNLNAQKRVFEGTCSGADLDRWNYAVLSSNLATRNNSLDVIWQSQGLALYVVNDELQKSLCRK
jgi:hypothetical protein